MNSVLEKNIFKDNRVFHQHDYVSNLKELVLEKAKKIPFLWPVDNFVASNPLIGFEDVNFYTVIDEISRTTIYSKNAELNKINSILIKWLAVYFDKGQAKISLPNKKGSLFESVANMLPYDSSIKISALINDILHLTNLQVIERCLEFLKIGYSDRDSFIEFNLNQLPGFCAYINYLCKYDLKSDQLLFDYLALRLIITASVLPPELNPLQWYKSLTKIIREDGNILNDIKTAENKYLKGLVSDINEELLRYNSQNQKKYDAQFVFCIDPRSERIRSLIENVGNYQTFGCAGFFNLFIRIRDKDLNYDKSSLPAILEPLYTIELSSIISQKGYRNNLILSKLKSLFSGLKYSFTTPLFMVELLGPIFGFISIVKTFFTRSSKSKNSLNGTCNNLHIDMPIDIQVETAFNLLASIGLTDNFSKIIIICGHKALTTNNLYQNALNCGACQGEKGGYNSIVISSILNNKLVRDGLYKKGLSIPGDTIFVASEHNTTTDEIYLCDADNIKYSKTIEQINKHLQYVRYKNSKQRISELNGNGKSKNSIVTAEKLSNDWSVVRPEWGLVRNACFIIGPREITKHIDLNGRAFLHSYNYKSDNQLEIIDGIINGPLAVAFWINTQYLFSTIDNNKFGSGCKTTQNMTGKIGVMQGNFSDLKIGLPIQSVYNSYDQPFHEPVRLSVFIAAPDALVQKVLFSNNLLKNLVKNEWINLFYIDPVSRMTRKMSVAAENTVLNE